MGMEEKFSPKREMRTGIGNILDGGTRVVKYPLVDLRPVDILNFTY
jgi:hypothetical protein